MTRIPIQMIPREALQHYRMWARKPAQKAVKHTILWPTDPALVGYATQITYRSDKWRDEGDFENYIHRFKLPETPFWTQRPDAARTPDERWLKGRPAVRKTVERPRIPYLTVLGSAMHVEYREERGGGLYYWMWKRKEQPVLLVQRERPNILVMAWPGENCWVLTSDAIQVTTRGIMF